MQVTKLTSALDSHKKIIFFVYHQSQCTTKRKTKISLYKMELLDNTVLFIYLFCLLPLIIGKNCFLKP